MDKPDFIQRGWELRRDIHAFIRANPNSTLPGIAAHFTERSFRTIDSSMRKLRADGDVVVAMQRGRFKTFRAISEQIKPVSESRKGLSMGGKKSVVKLRELQLARLAAAPPKPPKPKREPKPRKARARKPPRAARPPSAPEARPRHSGPRIEYRDGVRVTVHREGDTAPAQDSRGQGAAREPVYINCHQNF